MSHKHPDILNLIDDKLDMKIRNVKIRTTWDVMKAWTDITYTARIQHLMAAYHLSYQRIESILRKRNEKLVLVNELVLVSNLSSLGLVLYKKPLVYLLRSGAFTIH